MASVSRDFQNLTSAVGGTLPPRKVHHESETYTECYTAKDGDVEPRKANYYDMTNAYYSLMTSLYEFGWGESFHFAHRLQNETLRESIKRHEHYIALRLGLRPGMKVLDVGCGIGGPLREIAAFSGASITGLNINEYQIKRGKELNSKICGLDETSGFLKGDFMNIPAPENTYDAIYAIECLCHAPNLVGVLKEIKRVLKPGQLFAGFDWCMTKMYDPMLPLHKKIKGEIEIGNSVPDLPTTSYYIDALKEAGFEIIVQGDIAETSSPIPWYAPLSSTSTLSSFRASTVGRFFTIMMLRLLELAHFTPKGSAEFCKVVERGAFGLVDGGRLKIFTPMFFFLVKKVENE